MIRAVNDSAVIKEVEQPLLLTILNYVLVLLQERLSLQKIYVLSNAKYT